MGRVHRTRRSRRVSRAFPTGSLPQGKERPTGLYGKHILSGARRPVQRHAVFSVLLMPVVRKGMVMLMTISELTPHYCSCFSRYPRAKECLSFPGIHQHVTITPRNFLGPSSQRLQPHLTAIFSRQHVSDTAWWHGETRATQHLLQEAGTGFGTESVSVAEHRAARPRRCAAASSWPPCTMRPPS